MDARIYTDKTAGPVLAKEDAEAALPDSLFTMRSVAVVGASQDADKVGYAICRNMLNFSGALYPVNPKSPIILGKTAYPSLSAIPDTVDAVVIAIPAPAVPAIMRKPGKKKIPLVIIVSSGFRGTGPAGKALEEQVLATARRYGIRIMGPNCLGFMIPAQGINTTFDPVSPRPGSIAFISQSGAIITTIVDWSLPEEIGFSAVISVGNQLDLTFEDFIRWTAADPATNAIILYVEITNGRRFIGDGQPDHPGKTRDRDKIRLVKDRAEGGLVAHGLPSRERPGLPCSVPAGRHVIPVRGQSGGIPGSRTPRVRRIPQRYPRRRDHKRRRVCGALLGLCRAVRD